MRVAITGAILMAQVVASRPSGLHDLHETAVARHVEGALRDASSMYDEVLQRDPPQRLGADERAVVSRFRPRIFVTASEPFRLRDVVAVVHPRRPLIAYHLFWDDDIDFPDDNEPSDHEILWVTTSADRTRLAGLQTYFHGRILDAPRVAVDDARDHGGRPAVFVQWGKHGSMPLGWRQLTIEPEDGESEITRLKPGTTVTLEDYNRDSWWRLRTHGRRRLGEPLGQHQRWPSRYTGPWTSFAAFPREIDPATWLPRAAVRSEWNAAVLNRWFIRYNFSPKLEWPDAEPEGS